MPHPAPASGRPEATADTATSAESVAPSSRTDDATGAPTGAGDTTMDPSCETPARAPGAPRPGVFDRVAALEAQLARARTERDEQARAIEEELTRLSSIYERLAGENAALRAERDRAVEAARRERELRAKEILDLSEQLEAARDRELASPVSSPEAFVQARLAEEVGERRALQPGEIPRIHGYRVTGPLGQGGMATVFAAVQDKDGRDVAIKLLHEGPDASKSRTELFLREAAVMLQLAHPGLVRALDAGDCMHGRYLVLELVQGESLASLVRRTGPLPEKEALRVGLQVARALAYCARLGLTHRDVKPSNLLLDTTGRVRLCDFGLAALSLGNDPARPYGSPGYAAPEQISQPTSVDERVDVYALGCTLWHLVVGRRPFTGNPKDVFEAQRTQDLADPRFEGADVSPRFAQVVRRMGRAVRDRRYRRWDECILDLMLVENGNPPFAAHLADAQEPGSATLERTEGPPGDVRGGAELALPGTPHGGASSAGSPSGRGGPGGDSGGGTRAEDEDVLPDVRRPLPPPAPPTPLPRILLLAVLLAGAAVGYGASSLRSPPAVTDLLSAARARASSGDRLGAVASLRSAAELLDGEGRDRLRAEADRLASER